MVGTASIATICSESILQSAPQIAALRAQYQAASSTGGPNPAYIGTGDALKAAGIYGAPYKTPYSIQINGGIQREIMKGSILSVDYVHNATLKIPLLIDKNHVGAARFLNVPAAQAAIATTLAACNAASVQNALSPGGCPGLHPGVGGSNPGSAVITDFAANGLDSSNQYTGGLPRFRYWSSSSRICRPKPKRRPWRVHPPSGTVRIRCVGSCAASTGVTSSTGNQERKLPGFIHVLTGRQPYLRVQCGRPILQQPAV